MADLQSRTTFAGRDRELRELLESLTAAATGRGRLVLLEGEPGIGKSRLADELAARAREGGHEVLWGRGWEDAGAPAYWPWVQALRGHLRSAPASAIREQLGSGIGDVAQMLPELRDMFPDVPPLPATESESARFQLFDSTATLLRNAARTQPLLVVLDDLQAADTPSILLLRFLASQLHDMAILVVGTYRDVELTPDHPLTAAIAELHREPTTRVVALGGLDPTAVAAFIRETTEIAPQEQLVAAVWRATSGNPLFVGEAVRLLRAEGRLGDVADLRSLHVAVPAGVRAVIARRIGHLSESTTRTLALGAVLGPEFTLEVLRRVGEYPGREPLDDLDEAVAAGLVLPVAGSIGRYRFSHDLVRETLYDEQAPGERGRLHRRIAEVLEKLYANAGGGHLAELAFHYVQAVRHGDRQPGDDGAEGAEKAISYAREAGDDAARSLAYEEAARLYAMALEVLDIDRAPADPARAEILLSLGDVRARAGDLDAARTAFLEAADIARRTGDGLHLARAALGFGGRHQWARPGNDTKLIALLQDALVMLGGADERLRARLLTRLACAWRSSPERRNDSDILSRQAIEIARQLEDTATLAYTLVGRFWAAWWPDNPDERERLALEMVDLAAETGDGERIADGHFMSMLSLSERGRIAETRAELATLSRVIDELRQPAQLWLEPVNASWLALLAGDFGRAEELITREEESTFRVTPGRDDVSAARMHRFLLRREQGRIAEEEDAIRTSVAAFPWYPMHQAALVCALVDLGRRPEARLVFDELARDEFSALYRDNEWLLGMCIASDACALLDDGDAAAILYEQLAPFAGRHAIGHSEGSVGAVDRYLGLLAATRGFLDNGVDHLSAAIELNDRMGARPWTAHCQHDLAKVLRRRAGPGDDVRAGELDEAARATAESLGMVLATRMELPANDAWKANAGGDRSPVESATFRREGEYWTIEFGDDSFRLHDTRGLGHLARLLRSPGREIHALDLARLDGAAGGRAPTFELRADQPGNAGPVLDAEAKAAYRARRDEIRADLAEAERWNDPERAARLQQEERALTDELAAAVGLGGRDRAVGSAAERARVSVTRAIRGALGRIAEHSAPLGAHLDATIHTGTFCSYAPDPRVPIEWRL